jgi:hypothetical protein
MNKLVMGIAVLLATWLGAVINAAAQSELDRLESGIRGSNGSPVMQVTGPQRVYLGAVADDEAGRGVILLSVRSGGPADHAHLQAKDLITGAAGHKIRSLGELSTILNGLNPGDHLALEYLRGTKPLRTEVVLGAALGTVQAGAPPAPGVIPGRTESIPSPPGDLGLPPTPPEAPSLVPPSATQGPALLPGPDKQPVLPNSPQAQIDELRRRVDNLEHRIQELERALAEGQRK